MKNLLLLLALLFSQVTYAQVNFDNRVKQSVRCSDVSEFSYQMIPIYIQERQIDSLQYLLTYWDKKCGSNDIIIRINQMIAISRGEIDKNWFALSEFQKMVGVRSGKLNYYYPFYNDTEYSYPRDIQGYIEKLDLVLKNWASELLRGQDKCSDLYGYLLFYSGETQGFFEWLNEPCASNSDLAIHYQNEVTRFRKMWYTDAGGFIEIWMPYQGNIAKLGSRGGFGFYVGEFHNRFYYNGTMILRIGRTPQPYLIDYKKEIVETDYYLGWYVGGEIGYAIAKTSNFGIYALGGIGYDGFETLEPDDDDNDGPSYSLESLNLNSGLGFRQNVGINGYIGIEGRYNWVKYDNPGGTNLEGDFISIRLIFGGLTNYYKQQGLDALRTSDYKRRK